ncbi:MAG: aldo/keto reductase [Bacteroidales bacterium]|nr:aldo/keto reductase [Bacteroidales bacterium]
MKRRKFIVSAAAAVPAITLFPSDLSGMTRRMASGSVIGFGGIVVMNATPAEASERVRMAIDAGVNYFDVAPSYGDAEVKLGPALEPYRKNVFLACKTTERTKAGARKELEQSLMNMRTDHFDLYQHHAVITLEDVDTLLGPGGAMETFLEAKQEGKIRLIGFSAHSEEAAMALMERFDFDTILFPFSYAIWHAGNFGPRVLAKAKEKNMGILALKAMAKGPWQEGADRTKYPKCWYEPLTSPEDITMGLRFTLSHPVTAAIPPGDENLFRQALALSDKLKPLEQSEVISIKEKALKGIPLFKV